MTCENCEDGEHEECEDPEQTWMEWDTGAHHVQVCCCGTDEPDYEWEAEVRAWAATDEAVNSRPSAAALTMTNSPSWPT